MKAGSSLILPENPPRFCEFSKVKIFQANWGRNPALVYGCPSGRWVNHPNTGQLILYADMTPFWREKYDRKARAPDGQKVGIMRDLDPFMSPVGAEGRMTYVGSRQDKRDHMARFDMVEAGDVDFATASLTGLEDPSIREIQDDIYVAKQKSEQGWFERNPDDEDEVGGFHHQASLERDKALRAGGYLGGEGLAL